MCYGNKKKWGLPWDSPTRKPLVGFLPRSWIFHKKVIYGVIFLKFSEISKKWSDEFIIGVKKNRKKCNNIMVVWNKTIDHLTLEKMMILLNYDEMKIIWWIQKGWDHYPKWYFYGNWNFWILWFWFMKIIFASLIESILWIYKYACYILPYLMILLP